MAYEDAVTQSGTTIGFGKPGSPTEIEGFYMGPRTTTVEGRECLVHKFETSNGAVDVWGTTKLDAALATLPPTKPMTKVTYLGRGKAKGGFAAPHEFKVRFDRTNTYSGEAPVGLDEEETDLDSEQELDVTPPSRSVPPKGYAKASVGTQKAKELLAKRG